VPDSLVKWAVEKVERRRERHDVASRCEVSGGDAHFVFVVLDMLQNIDIDDCICALLGRKIGQDATSCFTTWQQVSRHDAACEMRHVLGVRVKAKPTRVYSVAKIFRGTPKPGAYFDDFIGYVGT
jgi:hypothetical protein